MTLIRPFRGLRARADLAAQVAAPPYDVMNTAEARQMAAGKPHSFLHVSRPEIDLADGVSLYDPACYQKAAANLQALVAAGAMQRDAQPCLYLYRLTLAGRSQLGIAAEVDVRAYADGRVKRHEFTRPDKEDDRMRHVEATNANSGPVFLVYRRRADVDAVAAAWVQAHEAVVDFVADDGVRHELWVVRDAGVIEHLVGGIEKGGALYIADGHHRCAAAARIAEARRQRGQASPDASHQAFLGVMFPDDQVKIYDYNRVVKDLAGKTVETFKAELANVFDMQPSAQPFKPSQPRQVGMYLAGQWYKLAFRGPSFPNDPVASLDVSLLQSRVLEPILSIRDPRTDKRIDFVGGIRGLGELQKLVDSGQAAVAFAMHATSLEQLLAVADAGQVMPPKSTWFEPKLRDGLVVQLLD